MNKKQLLIPSTLILTASVFGTNIAQADGIYISGKIGSSSLSHTIERNIGDFTLPVQDTSGVTTAQDGGVSIGGAVGYTIDVTPTFYVGAEGFFNYETSETHNINSVLVTDIELDYSYGGRALLGANVTDNYSVYAHGGVTILDFDITNSYTFAPPVREASGSEAAFSYGIGMDFKLDENISVFTEYTRIQDVDFTPIGEVAGDTGRINPNDLDMNTISLGFKYGF